MSGLSPSPKRAVRLTPPVALGTAEEDMVEVDMESEDEYEDTPVAVVDCSVVMESEDEDECEDTPVDVVDCAVGSDEVVTISVTSGRARLRGVAIAESMSVCQDSIEIAKQ